MSERRNTRKDGRHRTRAEADLLAEEFEASGKTRQAFSEERNVPLKTLARYVTRYRQSRVAEGASPKWVAVEVKQPFQRGGELSVILAGGRRIEVTRGFDVATLRAVVRALEQL
jgi:hypothetical protein